MSIYKTRPGLSLDFEIVPLESAIAQVTSKLPKIHPIISRLDFYKLITSPISFSPQFQNQETRLFYSPKYQKMMLGCSNTQHNSGRPEFHSQKITL